MSTASESRRFSHVHQELRSLKTLHFVSSGAAGVVTEAARVPVARCPGPMWTAPLRSAGACTTLHMPRASTKHTCAFSRWKTMRCLRAGTTQERCQIVFTASNEVRWMWVAALNELRAISRVFASRMSCRARTCTRVGCLRCCCCAGGEDFRQSAAASTTKDSRASNRFTCASRHGKCACWLGGPCDQPTCASYKCTCRYVITACWLYASCGEAGEERVGRFDCAHLE